MSQLSLFLTNLHSKQQPRQKWWAELTNAQRKYHKAQHYGFTREGRQLVILPEREILSKSYERKHNV